MPLPPASREARLTPLGPRSAERPKTRQLVPTSTGSIPYQTLDALPRQGAGRRWPAGYRARPEIRERGSKADPYLTKIEEWIGRS